MGAKDLGHYRGLFWGASPYRRAQLTISVFSFSSFSVPFSETFLAHSSNF